MGGGEVERRQSKTIAKIHYPQTIQYVVENTQILREINFREARRSKTEVFALFEGGNLPN